jgi:N-acetylglucosaminyldiphosphoundecaprenol N-acetyl-beta-D-mannosaminyltransferase
MNFSSINFFSENQEELISDFFLVCDKLNNFSVITLNLDFWVRAKKSHSFMQVIHKFNYRVCDGTPMYWLGLWRHFIYGSSTIFKITGSDLLPYIINSPRVSEIFSKDTPLRVCFVGGQPGAADKAALNFMSMSSGNIDIKVFCPDYGFENDIKKNKEVINFINKCKPNFLFIGLGSPKQEYWLKKYEHQMSFGVALCVGAAFDFYSGYKTRAPVIVQKLGFEWLWRMLSEPRRLVKRYLVDLIFGLPLIFKAMVLKNG